MVLKIRPHLFQREILCAVHENDRVRVAHGDTGHPVFFPLYFNRDIDHRRMIRPYRDLVRFQNGLSHIDADRADLSVLLIQGHILDLARADDRELFLISQTEIIDISGYAADPVAAHFTPGPVGVPHFHLKIRFFGRVDKDHPVAADAEMAVAEPSDQGRLLLCRYGLGEPVDIDIIVAAAFHFGKRKLHLLFPFIPHHFFPDPGPVLFG